MEFHVLFAIVLGAAGLFVGSFLYVAAIRVLNKERIFSPLPLCRHCQHRLKGRDLIPVVSYIAARGKCRCCGNKISPTRWIVEAATAFLFGWIGWHYGPFQLEWIAALLLCSVLIVITITDLKAMTIPNAVVFPAAALALAVRLLIHPLPLWNYAAGAAIGFGLLYLLAVLSKGGMGGGDIKLYLFIGLIGGISVTLFSLFLASMLGSLYALVRKAAGTLRRKEPIPFGPFIAAGAMVSFLYSERWVDGYVNLFLMM